MRTNAGSNLTPAQRKQAEIDARNDGIIQDAVERAGREGPKVEAVAANQQVYTTYDKLKSQHQRGTQSIVPIAVKVGPEFPGGFHWVLADEDYNAVLAGYFCGFCLCRLPEMWAPACGVCGADRDVVL